MKVLLLLLPIASAELSPAGAVWKSWAGPSPAPTPPKPAGILKGVAEAGADLGDTMLPGDPGKTYSFPKDSSIDHFGKLGFGVVRIPFLWERLQRQLRGDFDQEYLKSLKHTVKQVNKAGMKAVLVPQNWARYCKTSGCGSSNRNAGVIGAPNSGVTAEDFCDFWNQLAQQFKDNRNVIFTIMEEPNTQSTKLWAEVAQRAIVTIRKTGAKQLVLVPGNGWTDAVSWCETFPDTDHKKISNADAFTTFSDPADNFAFDMHQYLGKNGNPDLKECASETVGKDALREATEWLKRNKFRAFLGEFGGPATHLCKKAVDNMLNYLEKYPETWMGWTMWAAGSSPQPWWSKYTLNIEPDSIGGKMKDKPQTHWVLGHLTPPEPQPASKPTPQPAPTLVLV